jgi:hypothetical protein
MYALNNYVIDITSKEFLKNRGGANSFIKQSGRSIATPYSISYG